MKSSKREKTANMVRIFFNPESKYLILYSSVKKKKSFFIQTTYKQINTYHTDVNVSHQAISSFLYVALDLRIFLSTEFHQNILGLEDAIIIQSSCSSFPILYHIQREMVYLKYYTADDLGSKE